MSASTSGRAATIDVEVTEHQKVLLPLGDLFRPVGHPVGNGVQFGSALLGIPAINHVQRHQHERHIAAAKSHSVGRPCELPLQCAGSDRLEALLWDDQLAGQAGRFNSTRVEQKCEAFQIAGRAPRHVRHEKLPMGPDQSLSIVRNAFKSPFTSCKAMTSKRETISVMAQRARQSRFGD